MLSVLLWIVVFAALIGGVVWFMVAQEERAAKAQRDAALDRIERSIDALEETLNSATDEELATLWGDAEPDADETTNTPSGLTAAQAVMLTYAQHHGQLIGEEAHEERGYRIPATGSGRTLNSLLRRGLLAEVAPSVWRLTAAGERAIFDLGK